ncbi:AsnC family transcriptional regulator [bacterium]
MDDIDKKLMNMLQEEIPVTERPFAEFGEKLGISEAETLERVRRMDEEDRFRRIGPSFAPRKMGYTSTLCAARISTENFDDAVSFINKYPQITHNYERDDFFNVWFTVIARGEEEVERILDEIRENTGAEEVLNLPATHIFKILVQFDVEDM